MHRTLSSVLVGLSLLFPGLVWAQANVENPAPGSFQNGIGAVSGWKCTGGTLTFTIDNGPPAQLAYGTSRLDTQSVCGHSNTGFAYLINWNLTGDGQHTIRVFDNGVQFAQATFTVKTLGHEFLTGLTGETKVVNFGNQINVTMRWQESCQCFVIVDTTAPLRLGPPVGADPDGGGPLPFCENPDAGRLATANGIFAYYQVYNFIHRPQFLCAVSPDNPQYSQIQGNARAFPTNPGYVYYDVTLLNRFDAVNDFADDFILAHELGHQVQFDNLSRAAIPGTKQFELQADCLAGTYFGHLFFTNPEFMLGDAVGVTLAVCGVGLIENLGWASVDNHGKCEERAFSFEVGFGSAFSAYSNHQSFDPLLACQPS